VNVDDLPFIVDTLQNNRATIQEVRTIIEVKCSNGHVTRQHLDTKIAWLQIHVGWFDLSAANRCEDLFELCFNLSLVLGTPWECSWLEHGGIVRKRGGKSIPVKVVEGLDEMIKGLAD